VEVTEGTSLQKNAAVKNKTKFMGKLIVLCCHSVETVHSHHYANDWNMGIFATTSYQKNTLKVVVFWPLFPPSARWIWRRNVPPRRWYPITLLYIVTTLKTTTWILIPVKTSISQKNTVFR